MTATPQKNVQEQSEQGIRLDLTQLRLTETDRIEWKRSAQDNKGILRSVCALANDLAGSGYPGFLVIGLEKDGGSRPIAAGELDQVQQDLSNRLRSIKIQPTPSCDLSVHEVEANRFIVVVTISPYPVPPVVMVDGVAWVRQGPAQCRSGLGARSSGQHRDHRAIRPRVSAGGPEGAGQKPGAAPVVRVHPCTRKGRVV